MTTGWTAETRGTGAYADVNGLHLYYETRGSGRLIRRWAEAVHAGDLETVDA